MSAYGQCRVRSLIPFRSSRTTLIQHTIPKLRINSGGFWCGSIKYSRSSAPDSKERPARCIFFLGKFRSCRSLVFSGRPAPERPGADSITREAYSHEVSSAGFWPGGGDIKGPAFYFVCRAGNRPDLQNGASARKRLFLPRANERVFIDV